MSGSIVYEGHHPLMSIYLLRGQCLPVSVYLYINSAWHIFHYKVVLFSPSQYLIQSLWLIQPDSVGALGFCSYASLALFECLIFGLSSTQTCSDWAENPNMHNWMVFKVKLLLTRASWCKTSHAFVALILQLLTLYICLSQIILISYCSNWSFFPGVFLCISLPNLC